MSPHPALTLHPEVVEALAQSRCVVALESTLISHGLPRPLNLETAHAAEQAVREEGGVPATIAVWKGRPTIGLAPEQLQAIAGEEGIVKASRRDLGIAMAQGHTAGTTVAATMFLAHLAGIRFLATGGIGGAHRGAEETWDVSADLLEIARTPVAVVCAGAKSILDIERTLEILETYSVPVVGYGTDDFPAFYLRSSGQAVTVRVDNPSQAAALLQAHWSLLGAGAVIAQPIVADVAVDEMQFDEALREAEHRATGAKVRGKALTPFLLERLAEITEGKTLAANRALVINNARLATRIALAMQPQA